MQLPPTVLSIDKGNKQSSSSIKMATAPAKRDEPKNPQNIAEPPVDSTSSDSDLSEVGEGVGGVPITKVVQAQRHHNGLRPPRTLETTLFERLEKMYGSSIKRMLNVQYRYYFCPSRLSLLRDEITECMLKYVNSPQRRSMDQNCSRMSPWQPIFYETSLRPRWILKRTRRTCWGRL
jgi:hypothetical protein